MKLVAIFLCVAVAVTLAEVHWDENGQYRLVDSAPLAVGYYPIPVAVREITPFFYSYKQVKSGAAKTETPKIEAVKIEATKDEDKTDEVTKADEAANSGEGAKRGDE